MTAKVPVHTFADHALTEYGSHEHGPDADHDHDLPPGALEDNPIWLRDNVELTTVGIDVGSAGTQVIFSQIHLQRRGSDLSSRYVVVDRRTLHESPVCFTPYLDQHRIDGEALGRIIDDAYAGAGIRPGDIDTGVVILTGEALRRENAGAIAAVLAEKGGDFVTATAGNHMEAMLAAYGSGAARASHDLGGRVLNIDIGGGTTKLALVEGGEVRWTAAMHIGGRLIVVEDGRVTRIDPSGAHHAHLAGYHLSIGAELDDTGRDRIGAGMADLLLDAISPQPSDAARHLFLTDVPGPMGDLCGVILSGGVGEFVYGRENRDFGDLGLALGRALAARVNAGALAASLLPAAACIRATAVGASEYSVQLSGQTGLITRPGAVLPRRNMAVVKPAINLAADPGADGIAAAIAAQFAALDLDPAKADAVLALEWTALPEYARLRRLADGIAAAMAPRIAVGLPLHILIDGDIAQTLGNILRRECGVDVDMMVIDGITLRTFDYIDLGRIRLPSLTVPVTIKSLLFAEGSTAPGREERIHFRAPPTQEHDHHHDHHHHHHGDHHHHPHGHSHAVKGPA